MAVCFSNLHTEPGLKHLDQFLLDKTFISGDQPTRDDIKVFAAVAKPSGDFPAVGRWYNSVSALLAARFPGEAVGVRITGQASAPALAAVKEAEKEAPKGDEDDDDLDLFGDETEEDKKAAEAREAAKTSSKKKENMARSGDITWEHCTKIDSSGKVQCSYCGKVMSRGVTRMKQHLGGVIGKVIACDKVPPQVKLFFKDLVEKEKGKAVKKAKLEQEGMASGLADEAFDRELKIALRHSRQAAIEEERRREMRSGPGSGSRSDAGFMRRSNTTREQARIDRREKMLRKEEEDFFMAKRLSIEMEEKKKKMQRAIGKYEERKKKKKTTMAKFFRGIEKFYRSIGIKYKSSHKESLKEFVKIIREEDKDPSPPSSSDDVNIVIEKENDSSDDGSDWGESYSR